MPSAAELRRKALWEVEGRRKEKMLRRGARGGVIAAEALSRFGDGLGSSLADTG